MTIKCYELRELVIEPPKPGEFRIVTAAVWACALCGGTIDGMGGPGNGEICERCAEVLKSGNARGAIVWEKTP